MIQAEKICPWLWDQIGGQAELEEEEGQLKVRELKTYTRRRQVFSPTAFVSNESAIVNSLAGLTDPRRNMGVGGAFRCMEHSLMLIEVKTGEYMEVEKWQWQSLWYETAVI